MPTNDYTAEQIQVLEGPRTGKKKARNVISAQPIAVDFTVFKRNCG